MDLKRLKDLALAETARFFQEKFGSAPAEDSEEWEDEYRRQFDRLRKGATAGVSAPASPAPAVEERLSNLPALTGTPADQHWASALRSARLKQIQDKEMRAWLARSWTAAKLWIDTRELSAEAFVRRMEPYYRDARRRATADAAAIAARRDAEAKAAAALQETVTAAGISALGLIDLIDVSPRAASMPVKEKLAELRVEGRTVRVFATANPALLMVLDKRGDERSEYGIERDEGLVADLTLFARSGS
jgi:C4-dicarboxylate-specific signal transduction histidine kinase